MLATLQERGNRPFLLTPARQNAPQAARVICDMLAPEDFADVVALVIDWEGDIAWDYDTKGPMPQELKTPSLYVFASKWYQQIDRRVELELFIDLDDAFGKDNFDNSVAVELCQYMKDEFEQKKQEFEERFK